MSHSVLCRCALGLAVSLIAFGIPAAAEPPDDPELQGQAAIDYLRQMDLYEPFLRSLAHETEPDAELAGQQAAAAIAQQAYLKASNTGAGDFFADTVAVSADTVVVGASGEDSSATGVNGSQNDNTALDSGAAYVFTRSGSTWSVDAYLKASNTGRADWFGRSVATSGDTIVVGSPHEASIATGINGDQHDDSALSAGAAYVFVRSGTTWSQQAYLKAANTNSGDVFGSAVAISGDTLVVGARGEDSAATGVNGDPFDNSLESAGAVYVFVRAGTVWAQQAYLKASNPDLGDGFGSKVAISGDTLVVGVYGEDSSATGINGDQHDDSALSAGAAYVFARTGTSWSQQVYLKASNTAAGDVFGSTVAIAGDTIAVGAPGEDSIATGVNGNQNDNSAADAGAAYIFVRTGASWSQQAYLKASTATSGGYFGMSAGVASNTVLVGASAAGNNQALGAAYAFSRAGAAWAPQAILLASNGQVEDLFGGAVALDGDTIIVGASGEDSAATGINGNPNDNSADGAGAAYAFLRTYPPPPGSWLQTSALPGFRFKVVIGGDRTGTQVADCVPETLCIAGAIPTRSELFVRLIGPRPNGKLWAQAIRFTVSSVELWIEQTATGKVNHYWLESLPASTDTLSGLCDSLAFDP